jgi:hypothetical protein
MTERLNITKATGIFDNNPVHFGSSKSGQIKTGAATRFGKKIEVIDASNKTIKLNVGSLIEFLKTTDEGKHLKNNFWNRSSNREVTKAFHNYVQHAKIKSAKGETSKDETIKSEIPKETSDTPPIKIAADRLELAPKEVSAQPSKEIIFQPFKKGLEKIPIKMLNSSFILDVNLKGTVEDLKNQIRDHLKLPDDAPISLIYDGVMLEDDRDLEYYKLSKDSTIYEAYDHVKAEKKAMKAIWEKEKAFAVTSKEIQSDGSHGVAYINSSKSKRVILLERRQLPDMDTFYREALSFFGKNHYLITKQGCHWYEHKYVFLDEKGDLKTKIDSGGPEDDPEIAGWQKIGTHVFYFEPQPQIVNK